MPCFLLLSSLMSISIGVKPASDDMARLKPLSIFLSIACLQSLSYSIAYLDEPTAQRLSREDGLIETTGALAFLAASIISLFAWFYSRKVNIRIGSVFVLACSMAFMLGFLEEISWGQRIFNLKTPDIIANHNCQHEISIHNLDWFAGLDVLPGGGPLRLLAPTRLCNIFWLVSFVMIPISCQFSAHIRSLCTRFLIPIIPLSIGTLFVINHIMGTWACMLAGNSSILGHAVTEMKETNTEILFALTSAGMLSVYRTSGPGRIWDARP